MRRLFTISLLLLAGCTPNDAMPDRFTLNATVDSETGEMRSYSVGLQWSIRQPE